jgi:hydrogenase maturation protein HypF
MRFEELARDALGAQGAAYAFRLAGAGSQRTADAAPVIAAAAADVLAGVPAELVAARFHRAVADLVVRLAAELRATTGLDTVALSGGVFLNALLTTLCLDALAGAGFTVLAHRNVPPSDAGLALGQLVIGARAS